MILLPCRTVRCAQGFARILAAEIASFARKFPALMLFSLRFLFQLPLFRHKGSLRPTISGIP